MIPRQELDKAIELAKKYRVGKLYLIGSALHGDPSDANDYDFAVDEYPPESFFSFYGELMSAMGQILMSNGYPSKHSCPGCHH